MRSVTKIVAGGILLLWVALGFAWEQESNEFQFPIAGVKRGKNVFMKDLVFSSTYNHSKKSIVFSYSLPKSVKEAVMNVYSINGALVKTFILNNSATMISWSVEKEAVAVGTYAVSLKCGAMTKNLRLLLLK